MKRSLIPRRTALLLPVLLAACGSEPARPPVPSELASVSGQGQSELPGKPLAFPFVVRVVDSRSRPLADVTVSWSVDAGGGQVSITSSRTDAQGTTSVSYTLGPQPGENRVSATVAGVAPVTFASQATDPCTVGVATGMEPLHGNAREGWTRSNVAPALAVRVACSGDRPLRDANVQWRVLSGSVQLDRTSSPTDTSGVAMSGLWLGEARGSAVVEASYGSLPPVTFQVTIKDACDDFAGTLSVGDAATGVVAVGPSCFLAGAIVHRYRLPIGAPQLIRVRTEIDPDQPHPQISPFVSISRDGHTIAAAGHGSGFPVEVPVFLGPGEYSLQAGSSIQPGAYKVQVSAGSLGPSCDGAVMGTLWPDVIPWFGRGVVVPGELGPGDCQSPTLDNYWDLFRVHPAAGDTVRLEASSNAFGPHLSVGRSNAAVESTLSFTESTAVLTFVAPEGGEYLVYVAPRTFIAADAGAYTLRFVP